MRSPKALQSRGDYRLGDAPPQKILNFGARKWHFLRYPQDILINTKEKLKQISNVVVKVHCLRKKGKTVTRSRKLQAKGKIACMTAVSPRLYCEISLVRPVTRGGARGAFAPPPPPTGSNGPHFDTQYPS